MAIDAAQIRAARGLLDWTRDQLAAACGVSVPALAKIEGSKSSPHAETLVKVQSALEQAGIVFGDNSGVKRKSEIVEIFEGQRGYHEFLEQVYYLISRQNGGEILACGGSEKDFHAASGPEYLTLHAERMSKIKDFTMRAIKSASENYKDSVSYIQFRYLPDDMYFFVPFYLYANRLAIFLWKPSLRIIVINDISVCSAYRQQFELLWRVARRSEDAS